MKILVVEYKAKTISDIKSILSDLGHEIIGFASTGEGVIKKAGDLNPDLIVINLKLKGEMTGVEAAEKITKYHEIPIIFISVFTKNCLIKSLQLPDDAIVVSEPVKKEHLKYSISRAML
jgi:two-component SAPR family response regulator